MKYFRTATTCYKYMCILIKLHTYIHTCFVIAIFLTNFKKFNSFFIILASRAIKSANNNGGAYKFNGGNN